MPKLKYMYRQLSRKLLLIITTAPASADALTNGQTYMYDDNTPSCNFLGQGIKFREKHVHCKSIPSLSITMKWHRCAKSYTTQLAYPNFGDQNSGGTGGSVGVQILRAPGVFKILGPQVPHAKFVLAKNR